MIQTILYPTDLGLYSSCLLSHVIDLAKQHDANVMAVHAVEPLGVFADAVLDTYVSPDMVKEIKHNGLTTIMEAIREQVLEAFQEAFIDNNLALDRINRVEVLNGKPADVILEVANSCNADLIVMGSCSHHDGLSTSLGSVVSKVLQVSNIPVIMVPITEPKTKTRIGRI